MITKKVVLNKKDTFNSRTLNISLKDVTAKEKKRYDIKGGAKIIQNNNRTLNYYGITEGYIITKVNSKPVTTAAEATRKIENSKVNRGTPLFLELINPKGEIEKIVLR